MGLAICNMLTLGSASRFDLESLSSSQLSLVSIAGEKFDGAQVKGRSHMQNIDKAMASAHRVFG